MLQGQRHRAGSGKRELKQFSRVFQKDPSGRESPVTELHEMQEPIGSLDQLAQAEQGARAARFTAKPPRRCPAKARATRPSCWSASSRATKKISPESRLSGQPDGFSIRCWRTPGSSERIRSSPAP